MWNLRASSTSMEQDFLGTRHGHQAGQDRKGFVTHPSQDIKGEVQPERARDVLEASHHELCRARAFGLRHPLPRRPRLLRKHSGWQSVMQALSWLLRRQCQWG